MNTLRSSKHSQLPSSSQRRQKKTSRQRIPRRLFISVLALLLTSGLALAWHQSSQAASGNQSQTLRDLLGSARNRVTSALNLSPAPVAVQSGNQVPQMKIFTVAGGGFSTDIASAQAPIYFPVATLRDPQNRGFYFLDRTLLDGFTTVYLLRFLNTTAQPVTLAGTTINPGSVNLIAGGGTKLVNDTPAREVDMGQTVTGLVADPSGNAVYYLKSDSASLVGLNVSSQNFSIGGKTMLPGTIREIVSNSLFDIETEGRALAINPTTRFFYFAANPSANLERIYEIDPSSGTTNTLAGAATQVEGSTNALDTKFVGIKSMVVETSGSIIIAESGTANAKPPGRLLRLTGNTIAKIEDNLEQPVAVTLSPDGSFIYLALYGKQQFLRYNASNGSKTVLAGTGSPLSCNDTSTQCGDGGNATSAQLNILSPDDYFAFTADASGLLIPGANYNKLRYINPGNSSVTIAGKTVGSLKIDSVTGSGVLPPYDNSLATNAEMVTPLAVAADELNNLFVVTFDVFTRLRYVNRSQQTVTLFANTPSVQAVAPGNIITLNPNAGANDGQILNQSFSLNALQGLAKTSQGLYLTDSQAGARFPLGCVSGSSCRRLGTILFLNTSASDVTIFPNATSPTRIVVPPGGISLIAGIAAGKRSTDVPGASEGDNVAPWEAALYPSDVAVHTDGTIYIADQQLNKIRRINALTGNVDSVTIQGTDGSPLTLNRPSGVYLNAGRLYIADKSNNRVLRQVTPGGVAFEILADSTDGLNAPRDITADSSGHVYAMNSGTNQVMFINGSNGTTGAVAGTGVAGFSGDGGLGINAKINLPNPINTVITHHMLGITALSDDKIVFCDSFNNRIRLLEKVVNFAPVLAAIPSQTMNEGATLTVNLSATDQNNDPLTFSVTGNPAFGTLTNNNNGTAKIDFTPGLTDAGTYNLTVTVSDGTVTDSKTFTLTVNDTNRAPIISANTLSSPINATSSSGASVQLSASITDPDGDGITWKWFDNTTELAAGSGGTANATVTLSLGFHSIYLQATDSKGLSSSSPAQLVQVRDNVAPTIGAIPANQEFEGDTVGGKVFTFTNPTVSDNIDPNPSLQVLNVPANNLYPVGTRTITFIASDASGNQAQKSFTVKVNDTQKPVISGVPASVTFEGDTLGGKVFTFVSPTATDVVSGNVQVNASGVPSGNQYPVGTTTVNFTATDGANNSQTASFTVTVTDTAKPTINNVPANITTEATSAAGAVVNYTLPTATDIVDGNVTVTTSHPSGSTFPIGTTTVNFSAKDAQNNTQTASFTVTVRDTTGPAFSNVPANRFVPADSPAGSNVTFTLPTATDIVDGAVQVTANPPSGSLFPLGETTVTFTAKDSRNNTSTASFKINVVTVPPPVFSGVPADAIVEATSAAGAIVNYTLPTARDSQQTLLTVIASKLPGTVFPIGMTTVTFSATDSLGLSSMASFKVTVVDTTGPVLNGATPDIITESLTPAGANVNYALPTAVDAVDGPVTVTTSHLSGSLFPIGVTVVMLSAQDSRGNKSMRQFSITVLADVAYTITTFAGNGTFGSGGDGGQATAAQFRQIAAIARDKSGRLLVLDSGARTLRRIGIDGVITNIAGNGQSGNGGDNRAATGANFGIPSGLAVDSLGNIYIADLQFNRIRRIDPQGIITHFAGDSAGAAGSTGDLGTAAGARLRQPRGLAVDAMDNLFIADSGNNRVRRVDAITRVITTVAGTGGTGYNGDGAPAASLNLSNPTAVAVDTAKNLFIADAGNQRIRRVDGVTQFMTTIAGNGTAGFSGDDGPASNSQINTPMALSTDDAGNVFIADQNNHRIRRISKATGRIRTVAGDIDASDGTQTTYNGDNIPARGAFLGGPNAVVSDESGNSVFVGDVGNLRVRRLSVGAPNNAPVITSSIGNQTITKNQTVDLPLTATDADNDPVTFTLVNAPAFASIVNADAAARTATLRLAPTTTGTFNGVQIKAEDGKGGSATSAAFNITVNDIQPSNQNPTGSAAALPAMIEATSAAGASVNLSGSGSDPDGDPVSFIWKDGNATIATTANATVTLALGNHSITLMLSDGKGGTFTTTAQAVLVKDSTPPVISNVPANITTAATSAAGAAVNYTLPTATDPVSGNVPVNTSHPSGSTFAVGTTTVNFSATDVAGNTATASFTITVTPFNGGGGNCDPAYTISTVAGNGVYGYSGDNNQATAASFRQISAVARDNDGNLLIADSVNRVIRRVNAQGVIMTIAGTGASGNAGDGRSAMGATFNSPSGLAVDAQGNIYVSDAGNNRVRVIRTDGKIFHYAGDTGGMPGFSGDFGQASSAKLRQPRGLATDAQGNLFIADSGNHRIRRVDAASKLMSSVAGNGIVGYNGDNAVATQLSLNNPLDVAVDAQGNLFIADAGNHRIRRVDLASQQMTTYAGTGIAGFSGDGGNAAAAQLNNPGGVSLDSAGNLFVTDQNTNRVRRIAKATNQINTIANLNGAAGFTGDGGSALIAQLSLPGAIASDDSGNNVFVGDVSNLRIRKLTGNCPQNTNNAPAVANLANINVVRGQVAEIPFSASDADNDPVTFTLLNAPAFASIINANPATRTATLRVAPAANEATGTINGVIIQGSDGKGGTGQNQPFSITVTAPATNNPPTAVIAGGASVTVVSSNGTNATVTMNGSGSSDPDGDALTYEWKEGATTLGTTATITPTLSIGAHVITLTVNDGKGGTNSATQTVNVTQAVGNQSPTAVIAGGASVTINAPNANGAVVTLNGSGSTDPDGDPLTYEWKLGNTVIGNTAIITPTLPVGNQVITLTVSDGKGGTSTAMQTVNVVFSSALVLNSISPASGRQGQTLDVMLQGSGFVPGAFVTFNGSGVTAVITSLTSTQINLRVTIVSNARTGAGINGGRTVTVTNPSGVSASLTHAFAVFPR